MKYVWHNVQMKCDLICCPLLFITGSELQSLSQAVMQPTPPKPWEAHFKPKLIFIFVSLLYFRILPSSFPLSLKIDLLKELPCDNLSNKK